jgi:nitrogen fixation protein FixH
MRFGLVIGVFILLAGLPAHAQGHDHGHAAPHGGQVKKIGSYHAELVVKGSEVALYIVNEKEEKVDASKFSATVVVLAKGNEQKAIELKPAGENKLAGAMNFDFDGKFRATATLRSAMGEIGKGRYSLDAAR